MCVTATNNMIGSSIFVIDCYELLPGEKPRLAVEVCLSVCVFRGARGIVGERHHFLSFCLPSPVSRQLYAKIMSKGKRRSGSTLIGDK
jgi:hypothetical protein